MAFVGYAQACTNPFLDFHELGGPDVNDISLLFIVLQKSLQRDVVFGTEPGVKVLGSQHYRNNAVEQVICLLTVCLLTGGYT